MSDTFFHGIELIEINDGIRSFATVRSSVIGLIGTAPAADPARFPLNVPVLITSTTQIAGLGATGTLPAGFLGIYSQATPFIVVIRVEEGADAAATQANVIGAVSPITGARSGSYALQDARSILRVTPRLLIAPGFTHIKAVTDALLLQAEKLKAMVIADEPNTTDIDATAYRGEFDNARLYIVDPMLRISTASGESTVVASPYVAGLIAASDNERGFWWSPSNRVILGVNGPARPIAWAFNDPSVQANYLNENAIATIIHEDGYRLWGNRTAATDPRWTFFSVRRTADMINESLIQAHLWAVDRNITRTYIDDVTGSVNAYLRRLKALGAVLGGKCYADPELNTPENIALGRVYFDFDFTAPYPAERVTFRSHMVNDYLSEVL